jgi:peptide/nickel transport system permease protein
VRGRGGTGERRGERSWLPSGRFALGAALVCVPLVLALFGPLFAGEPGPRATSFTLGGGHWLGTDFVGRDVWRQVLFGGRPVVVVALAATTLAYLVALPVGLISALTHRAWLEEVLMRPLDVLLAVPSLLMILLVASVFSPGAPGLALLVALVNIPDAARIVRAAAADVASRPAVEALRMQGESWWRIAVGHVGRSILRPLAADAGVRLTGVLYLVATAAFLGIGVAPGRGRLGGDGGPQPYGAVRSAVGRGGPGAADRDADDGLQSALRRTARHWPGCHCGTGCRYGTGRRSSWRRCA